MTQAQKLKKRMTISIVVAAVVIVFAVWASVALADTASTVTISQRPTPIRRSGIRR